jgi:hypothetical protein
MPDTLPAQPEMAGATEPIETRPPRRWSRGHTIWLLMVLSLLPGVLIAFDREAWTTLPGGVRGAIYLTCAVLIAAACGLIIRGGEKE